MTPSGPSAARSRGLSLTDIEIQLLLEGVHRISGFDLREYAPGYTKRRVEHLLRLEGLDTVSALQDRTLHDDSAMQRLLDVMLGSGGPRSDSREFYAAFRTKVVPYLRTYPFVRIWMPAPSGGRDLYALAGILREEGLLARCRVYATEQLDVTLARVRSGRSNGVVGATTGETNDGVDAWLLENAHCVRKGDELVLAPELQAGIVFGRHNLATDGSFSEFNAIVYRNGMERFGQQLQSRVHRLFYESLVRLGFLALGASDTLRHSPHEGCFEEVDRSLGLYRRVR
jgi:chemotaxis protein methyltransferase CheR